MKLSPEHQANEREHCLKGYRTYYGMLGGRQFQWSREKSGIIQNFLWDVLGKGPRRGKEEIKTDWISL